jgi:hypothetical protein
MSQELTVGFNPMPAAERVAHYSGLVRTRLIWLGIAVLLCLAMWIWQRNNLDPLASLALFGAGLGYSVVWLILAIVGLATARRILSRVGQGVALRIGRAGIDLLGAQVPWSDVAEVTTTRGRAVLGAGPALTVRATTGTAHSVPFLYLDTRPGTIDSAVRAYSLGTRWLDTTRLGN